MVEEEIVRREQEKEAVQRKSEVEAEIWRFKAEAKWIKKQREIENRNFDEGMLELKCWGRRKKTAKRIWSWIEKIRIW